MLDPTETARAVLEAAGRATEGPWKAVIDDTGGPRSGWPLCVSAPDHLDRSVVRTGGMWPYEWDRGVSQKQAVDDQAFIALSRTAAPALAQAYLDASAEIERLKADATELIQISGDLNEEITTLRSALKAIEHELSGMGHSTGNSMRALNQARTALKDK